MGKISRKIKRSMIPARQNAEACLSPADCQRIYDDIADKILSKFASNVFLTLMDILDNNYGDIRPREERFQTFGKIFKKKFERQCKTNDNTYSNLLDVAGLRKIDFLG